MSDIPFANKLRRELTAAITAPATGTQRRWLRLPRGRRLGLLAMAAVIAIGGTAVAATLLTAPEKLAATEVDCGYDAVKGGGGVGISPGSQDPVAACRAFLAGPGRALVKDGSVRGGATASLVACVRPDIGKVVVIAGRQGDCERYKLRSLPGEYTPARAKVAKLERDLRAIEDSAECIPSQQLARRVQALLDRSGWTGWRTWVRSDLADGPCGYVLSVSEGGGRTIEPSLDLDGHRLMVFGRAPRSTMSALKDLSPALAAESGARCYTVAGLEALVRQRVAPTGRRVSFKLYQALQGSQPPGPAGARYAAGCAILEKIGPDPNGRDLIALILEKR